MYPKQIKLMIKSTILDMYKNTVGSILNNLLNNNNAFSQEKIKNNFYNLLNIIARPFVQPVINSLGSKNKW